MQIIIDDVSVELDLPKKDVSLRSVITETEEYLFSVGKVAVGLTLNGQELTEEQVNADVDKTATDQDILHFAVLDITDYILGNLDAAMNANDTLKERLLTFSEEILSATQPSEKEALVSEFTQFFDFWLSCNQIISEEVSQVKFGQKSFHDYISLLQSLLEEIVEAMEKNDFVLAADLLQYEVVSALDDLPSSIEQLKKILLLKKERQLSQENAQKSEKNKS